MDKLIPLGIQYNIQLSDDNELHIRLNAMAIGQYMSSEQKLLVAPLLSSVPEPEEPRARKSQDFVPFEDQDDEILFKLEMEQALFRATSTSESTQKLDDGTGAAPTGAATATTTTTDQPVPIINRISQAIGAMMSSAGISTSSSNVDTPASGEPVDEGGQARTGGLFSFKQSLSPGLLPSPSSSGTTFIEITPLTHVPGSVVVNYIGRLSLHFVKEDLNLHHAHGHHYTDSAHHYADAVLDDGLGTFIHKFTMEVQAIARAHTLAMGGNALVAFRIEHSLFRETIKNQAYGLLSVSGDVVEVRYEDAAAPLVTGEEMVRCLWESHPNLSKSTKELSVN